MKAANPIKKIPVQKDYGTRPNSVSNALLLFREARSEGNNVIRMDQVVATCLAVDAAIEKIIRRRLNSW